MVVQLFEMLYTSTRIQSMRLTFLWCNQARRVQQPQAPPRLIGSNDIPHGRGAFLVGQGEGLQRSDRRGAALLRGLVGLCRLERGAGPPAPLRCVALPPSAHCVWKEHMFQNFTFDVKLLDKAVSPWYTRTRERSVIFYRI